MRLWRFAQGDAQLAQDLLSAMTSPVRENIGSNCVGLLWVISGPLSADQECLLYPLERTVRSRQPLRRVFPLSATGGQPRPDLSFPAH